MAATPYTIDFPDHYRGDRWPGFSLTDLTIDGSAPTAPLERVRMHFIRGSATYILDSDATATRDAAIVIDDAAAWDISAQGIADFLPTAGAWDWDLEFTDDGTIGPITLYRGTLTVTDDRTK